MTHLTPSAEEPRRHALIIGVAHYAEGWGDIAAGVGSEMGIAQNLFKHTLAFESCELYSDLLSSELLPKVAKWRRNIAPTERDWLVVYYTGHGVIDDAGHLHLITSDIDPEIPESAPLAQAFVSALLAGESLPPHVLLILDTCHSGAGHQGIQSLASDSRENKGGAARGADFHVIATTRSIAEAIAGRFMAAMREVLQSATLAGPDEPFVQPALLVAHVNRLLGTQRCGHSAYSEAVTRFLPNRAWIPRLRPGMDTETRALVLNGIRAQTLAGHWDPRSRGVASGRESGWFFTGRARAMCEAVGWLSKRGTGDGLVVTGGPGSGKSALLARLVTLSDAEQRQRAEAAHALDGVPAEELPPVGFIDVAIHARAKDSTQIALEIAAALGLEQSEQQGEIEEIVAQAITQQGQGLVVAVDALDEAIRPEDCAVFLRALLGGGARLLVGVRRDSRDRLSRLTSRLGTSIIVRDLDAPPWSESDDLRTYVARVLTMAVGSPYAGAGPEQVKDLVEQVAGRARNSFLIASLTAWALAARDTVAHAGELTNLPASIGEAFEFDLKRFSNSARGQLRNILTSLAYAEGRGLPDAEWLLLSRALAGGDMVAEDLDGWKRDAGFYIVDDEEHGQPVHRLYHEEFAAHLRSQAPAGTDSTIANALVANKDVRMVDWATASSYVLANFARHLWRAGRCLDLRHLVDESRGWIAAKRRRLGDLTLVLDDFDRLADLARRADPVDLDALVIACAAYARHATTAPPLAIRTLADLGQQQRARLMAEAIQFPLDRCHAFALLAKCHHDAGEDIEATECLRASEHAAAAVIGHFQSMALYWVATAARHVGRNDYCARSCGMIGTTLRELSQVVSNGDAFHPALPGWRTAHGGEVDRTFALPHWLFWAAKCFRELEHREGIEDIRAVFGHMHQSGKNLDLQTAALIGEQAYLREIAREYVDSGSIVKPGNLGLALIEAGLQDEFDRLRSLGAFSGPGLDDTHKRYAWALARRGDFAAALDAARTIADPEEAARALFRIAGVAQAAGRADVLASLASAALELLEQQARASAAENECEPQPPEQGARAKPGAKQRAIVRRAVNRYLRIPPEPWRIRAWLAPVLLAGGRRDDAADLVEKVCSAGIVPSVQTSLDQASPNTASAKGHVIVETAPDSQDKTVRDLVRIAKEQGSEAAVAAIDGYVPSAHGRALALLAIAAVSDDASKAFDLWLDSLFASRRAGSSTLEEILYQGRDFLARANSGWSVEKLHEHVRPRVYLSPGVYIEELPYRIEDATGNSCTPMAAYLTGTKK